MIYDALLSGLVGFLVVEILMQPFEVFGWFPPLLRRLLFGSDNIRDYDVFEWWQVAIYKPLAGCGKCFAGWFSIGVWFYEYRTFIFPDTLFFVAVAVFSAWVLTAGKERLGLDN